MLFLGSWVQHKFPQTFKIQNAKLIYNRPNLSYWEVMYYTIYCTTTVHNGCCIYSV